MTLRAALCVAAALLAAALHASTCAALTLQKFSSPGGDASQILADGSGNILVLTSSALSKMTSTGTVVYTVSLTSSGLAMALGWNNTLWVLLYSPCTVVKVNATTGAVLKSVTYPSSPFTFVGGVAVDQQGNPWVVQWTSNSGLSSSFSKLSTADCSVVSTYSVPTGYGTTYSNILIDASNNIFLSGDGIVKYDSSGTMKASQTSETTPFMVSDDAGNIYSNYVTTVCTPIGNGGSQCTFGAIKYDSSLNVKLQDSNVVTNMIAPNPSTSDTFLNVHSVLITGTSSPTYNPTSNVQLVGATNGSVLQTYTIDTACLSLDYYIGSLTVRQGAEWWVLGDGAVCKVGFDETWSPSASPVHSAPSSSPSSQVPSTSPSRRPSASPTSEAPSKAPSRSPSRSAPTFAPSTSKPSRSPTRSPFSQQPSASPTHTPSRAPASAHPSSSPSSSKPTASPTARPSASPSSSKPTVRPSTTQHPSASPSVTAPAQASVNIAAAVGGSAGGFVALLLVGIAATLMWNRRRRSASMVAVVTMQPPQASDV